MRWVIAILVAAIAAGCTILPSSSTGTTGAGGGDAGAQCLQTSGCTDCTQCALEGPCASLYAACNDSSDCIAIDDCFAQTTPCDATCQATCYAGNPAGQSTYEAVLTCVNCTQCPTACAGQCTTQ
jgi:hypothetical protein